VPGPKKIGPLHETDLARIALLPLEQKRIELQRLREFVPTHSWNPFRLALPAIFQAKKSLLDLPRATWPEIKAGIGRACKKHPGWLEPNLQLAKLVFEHASEMKVSSIEWSFGGLAVGFGAAVRYWPEFYIIENDLPVILSCDPRRGNGYTKLAHSFVFSAMHHHIARGDFLEARFRIASFPVNRARKERSIRYVEMHAEHLIDYDLLNRAVQETYNIWFEVLEEREEKARREAPTGTGGLFGS
jgi:hypothetical protein